MRIMTKRLIAISARDIEINFVFTLVKIISISVENLIPSSGRAHSYAVDHIIKLHYINFRFWSSVFMQSNFYPCTRSNVN